MLKTMFIIAAAFLSFLPDAMALTCLPTVLDQAKIDAAEVVFEGKVIAKSPLAKTDYYHMQKETFEVTHAYKGVKQGDHVDLYRDIYWGDGINDGDSRLVLSFLRDGADYGVEGKAYFAPVCIHTNYFPVTDENKKLLQPK